MHLSHHWRISGDLYIALHAALLAGMHAMPNISVARVIAVSENRFKPEMRGLIVQTGASRDRHVLFEFDICLDRSEVPVSSPTLSAEPSSTFRDPSPLPRHPFALHPCLAEKTVC